MTPLAPLQMHSLFTTGYGCKWRSGGVAEHSQHGDGGLMRWLKPSSGAGQAARPGPCCLSGDLGSTRRAQYIFVWGLDVAGGGPRKLGPAAPAVVIGRCSRWGAIISSLLVLCASPSQHRGPITATTYRVSLAVDCSVQYLPQDGASAPWPGKATEWKNRER